MQYGEDGGKEELKGRMKQRKRQTKNKQTKYEGNASKQRR